MTIHKRVEITLESGTVEVFPRVEVFFACPSRIAVKQDQEWHIRGGKITNLKVS